MFGRLRRRIGELEREVEYLRHDRKHFREEIDRVTDGLYALAEHFGLQIIHERAHEVVRVVAREKAGASEV